MPLPTREDPQAAAAPAASFDLINSSLEFAACARWYVSPKRGAKIARDAVWLKTVPRAIAEGFTGGRSNSCRTLAKTLNIEYDRNTGTALHEHTPHKVDET